MNNSTIFSPVVYGKLRIPYRDLAAGTDVRVRVFPNGRVSIGPSEVPMEQTWVTTPLRSASLAHDNHVPVLMINTRNSRIEVLLSACFVSEATGLVIFARKRILERRGEAS